VACAEKDVAMDIGVLVGHRYCRRRGLLLEIGLHRLDQLFGTT
jgi:hypothetical protein